MKYMCNDDSRVYLIYVYVMVATRDLLDRTCDTFNDKK